MAASSIASAAPAAGDNPFAMNDLNSGYMQVASAKDGKCGEGKCGDGMKKKKDEKGKCGEAKGKKEGKCGEGKQKEKGKEGKCGGSN
jgi:uncharacterized low-complexity protein